MADVIKDLETALQGASFTEDVDAKVAREEFAEKANMHQNGPYKVHSMWKRGTVSVFIEQTVTQEDQGGMISQVTHQPVAVIEGPKGRVAAAASDVEAVLFEINAMG